MTFHFCCIKIIPTLLNCITTLTNNLSRNFFFEFLVQSKPKAFILIIVAKLLHGDVEEFLPTNANTRRLDLIMNKSNKQVNFYQNIGWWIAINTKVLDWIVITSRFDLEFGTSDPISTMKFFLVSSNLLVQEFQLVPFPLFFYLIVLFILF